MAEFQTGESVPVANGGTGLTAIGSAGQIIKVNAAGNALEFGAEGDLSITNLVAPTNADLTLTTSGTGNIVLDAITVRGTTISSADSSTININDNVEIDGNLVVTGTVDFNDQNISNVGSLSIDSISGDADTNTSITFSGSDVITIATGGSGRLTIGDGALSPVTDNEIDLGTSSLEFKDAFFDGTVTTDALTVSATSTLADTNITGAATITNTSTDDSLLITSTEASNSAAPVITLKRNSGSPADADYLGRIKFKGENDADQEVQYGSISGKITDASDGTEDGAIEFNVKKAGSNTIAVRINSDEVKLLNSTTLDVDGSGTFATDVSVGDDLTLVSDGAILSFGANSEIALTHVHDTGILLTDSGGTPTIQLHDANESVSSDGTNLIITSGGTAFKMPTSDGSAGQALITDGAGNLSFDTVTTTVSDDSRAVVKNNKKVNTSARTVDYFQESAFDMAWYFMALNDLTNDHTSGSVFTVCHNNSAAFISGARGGSSGTGNLLPITTASIAADQVLVKITGPSADGKVSFYKIPISTANTANATSGNTVTTSNVDVDSGAESIDTFAHASFRAAKYTILIDDDAKTETGVTEALVVHDGTNAFVSQFGTVNTGNNDMITLSAAISGGNVVVSAAGLAINLKLKIHKILLSDSMTASANGNQKVIGATTVSSTATAFDIFDLDDTTAAVYYVVGKNASEGTFSVQEVYMCGDIGEVGLAHGPFVSTKESTQLEFAGAYIGTVDNTVQMSVSSTSGGSTVVNAYRISCLAEE